MGWQRATWELSPTRDVDVIVADVFGGVLLLATRELPRRDGAHFGERVGGDGRVAHVAAGELAVHPPLLRAVVGAEARGGSGVELEEVPASYDYLGLIIELMPRVCRAPDFERTLITADELERRGVIALPYEKEVGPVVRVPGGADPEEHADEELGGHAEGAAD